MKDKEKKYKYKSGVVEPQIKELCHQVANELIDDLYYGLDKEQHKIDDMTVEEKIDLINKFESAKKFFNLSKKDKL